MAKVVRCPRARVWRALTAPAELIRWDTRRVSLEEAAPAYPTLGRSVRWRIALGNVTLPQREEPVEVVVSERLRSAVWLGSFRFDESFTLSDEPMGTTRLSLTVAAKNSMPMLGGELDRFDVRRLATERVAGTLEMIQRWCEADGRRAGANPGAPG